jgi:hypothetical protein
VYRQKLWLILVLRGLIRADCFSISRDAMLSKSSGTCNFPVTNPSLRFFCRLPGFCFARKFVTASWMGGFSSFIDTAPLDEVIGK